MPTYEYRCKRCQHRFEKQQPITSNPFRTCPECGKKTLERVIGAGAGILLGGRSAPGAEAAAATAAASSAAKKPEGAGAAVTGATGPGATSAGAAKPGEAKSATPATAPAADAAKPVDTEKADWKSKATHPSREGRGIGNMKSLLTGRGGGKRGGGGAPRRNARGR